MLRLHDVPGTHSVMTIVPPHTTSDSTVGHPVFYAPFDCTMTAVKLIHGADVTGQATNYFTWTLRNRGTAGTATTSLATRAYSGTAVTDSRGVPRTLYSTETNLSAGQIIELEWTKAGNGLASPPTAVIIEYKAR